MRALPEALHPPDAPEVTYAAPTPAGAVHPVGVTPTAHDAPRQQTPGCGHGLGLQSAPGMNVVLLNPAHTVCWVFTHAPLDRQHAPLAGGQVEGPQTLPLPLYVPPPWAHWSGDTGPVHAPEGEQHAPIGHWKNGVHVVPIPWKIPAPAHSEGLRLMQAVVTVEQHAPPAVPHVTFAHATPVPWYTPPEPTHADSVCTEQDPLMQHPPVEGCGHGFGAHTVPLPWYPLVHAAAVDTEHSPLALQHAPLATTVHTAGVYDTCKSVSRLGRHELDTPPPEESSLKRNTPPVQAKGPHGRKTAQLRLAKFRAPVEFDSVAMNPLLQRFSGPQLFVMPKVHAP